MKYWKSAPPNWFGPDSRQFLPSPPLKKTTLIVIAFLTLVVPAATALAVVLPHQAAQVSEADAIAAVTGFYQIIFAVLAMLLGLVVALAYLTIRAVSREAAQQTMLSEMDRYFNNDMKFDNRINDKISNEIYNMDLVTKLEALSSRVSLLELRNPASRGKDVDEEPRGDDAGTVQEPTR